MIKLKRNSNSWSNDIILDKFSPTNRSHYTQLQQTMFSQVREVVLNDVIWQTIVCCRNSSKMISFDLESLFQFHHHQQTAAVYGSVVFGDVKLFVLFPKFEVKIWNRERAIFCNESPLWLGISQSLVSLLSSWFWWFRGGNATNLNALLHLSRRIVTMSLIYCLSYS